MTNNVDFLQMYLAEVSRQTANQALLVQIVVSVVGVIFGLGAFLVWRENKSVIAQAQAQLSMAEEKIAEIDSWYAGKKSSLDSYLSEEFNKFNIKIEEMRCYQTLVMALEHTGTHSAMIYPALCVLAERPSALYVGVFREIIRLNISAEITQRAEMGLHKWEQIREKAPVKGG